MSKLMKKIKIPLLALNPSGGVRVLAALANGLALEGLNVEVIAPGYACRAPVPIDERVKVNILPVQHTPGSRLVYALKLLASIGEERSLFVASGYKTPLLISASCWLRGRRPKILYLIQNYEPDSHIKYGNQPLILKPLLYFIARLGFVLPGFKVAVSSFVAQRVGRKRIHRIINPGIDDSFFSCSHSGCERGDPARGEARYPPRRNRRIGFLPSPGRQKGVRYAVEALQMLRETDQSLSFLVFDRDYPTSHLPPFLSRYSSFARKHGLANTTVDFYRSCGIFVFPSIVEGFGLPPLEAMACGAALVTTRCGGVMEYARDGENCLMVPPGDPEALREAIQKLLQDSRLRGKLAEKGKQTALRFKQGDFIRKCTRIVKILLSEMEG